MTRPNLGDWALSEGTARVIRNRALARVPWKNGGGTTVEISASPAGAGFDDFDWRISMADIGTDGPFSSFPGIDRTLVLIDGLGVELAVDGRVHRLDALSSMLAFAGESITAARLLAGAIRDLNVMTRRGRYGHAVTALAPGTIDWTPRFPEMIGLVATRAPLVVHAGEKTHLLDRFDMLFGPPPLRLAADRPALLIRLWPVSSGSQLVEK